VVRLGPEDDATAVTATQLRAVTERLISAGQWAPGDPDITIVMDAGYDVTRLAWIRRDLPVELVPL
jgi:DDE superfamily endonuclease